jgi:hypothetical protein
MRRVLYALPFLLIGLGVLMVELTGYRLLVVGLNWLTFLIEYRYGGEGREGELVAIGIATSLALLPVSPTISKVLAVFTLLLVLGGNYMKALCVSQ